LEILNLKIIMIGLINVCQWRVRELDRGEAWWDCIKDDMKSFGLSHKEVQDKDDWRVRIKVATGQPCFTWKMAAKMVYMCVCVTVIFCVYPAY